MSNWDYEPVPDQEWTMFNRIPRQQTALFSGEGAGGKSTIWLHASAAHVLGREWLGVLPEMGPALFIDAEDGEQVIHRRLAPVIEHYGVTYSNLIKGGLDLLSLAGKDAVLATASRSGKIEPTPLYKQILERAGDTKPISIGLASSANMYAGSEIDRSQVQQFINLLTRIAIVANGSVTLISHPSLTGISSDTGLSGNTAWHNAVRARFYLKGLKPDAADEQPNTDLRELVFKKNQYGPVAKTSHCNTATACSCQCQAQAEISSTVPPRNCRPMTSSSLCCAASPPKIARSTKAPARPTPPPCSPARTRPSRPGCPARRSMPPCADCSRLTGFGTSRAGNHPGPATG